METNTTTPIRPDAVFTTTPLIPMAAWRQMGELARECPMVVLFGMLDTTVPLRGR